MNLFTKSICIAALAMATGADLARGETPVAQAGREILNKNSRAIVTLLATRKVASSSASEADASEQPVEAQATVIDPSGLTVVANSLLMEQQGRFTIVGGKLQRSAERKGKLSDLKIRLPDGTEIPAKLMMTDEDLDLAFIRPDAASEPAKKLTGKYACTKMEKTPAPQPLDELLSLTMLGEMFDRQVVVRRHDMVMALSKPQVRYVAVNITPGLPIFNLEGKAIGLAVVKRINKRETTVILPASEIAELAKQVPQSAK